jgi:hypothetical protein
MFVMNSIKRPLWLWLIIFIAFIFGALTIKSGGAVIFFDGPARIAAGNYLNFVVWFNFVAGFFYILAGVGFLLNKEWTTKLAAIIALLTVLVFTAFGMHIFMGGSYEMRTVMAMTLRCVIWIGFAYAAYVLSNNDKNNLIN